MQTTNNQMGRDLKSRKVVPQYPSPNTMLDFAHHDGNEVLHCCGAKWHHAQALLVVYSAEPASNILKTCTVILDADCFTNWQKMVNTSPSQLKNMMCMTTKAPRLLHAPSSSVTLGQATQHFVVSYEGQMTASMTHQLLTVI